MNAATSAALRRLRLILMLGAALAAPPAMAITSYEGDPGLLGDPASWRTTEFRRDWGLRAIGAEYAYARGFSGAGIKIGAIDSGYFDLHPELPASRYQGVSADGIAGAYNQTYNDRHGTHVTGTIGAARDAGTAATNFHGVAFNGLLYVGNTGKTDGALFGMPQLTQTEAQTIDQAHVANVYRAVNAQGVRILTSSWGSQPNTEQYDTLGRSADRAGLIGAWGFLAREDTWMKGALDAAATGTVVIFSAGNTGYANPSGRASMAYFRPDLEASWLGVSGLQEATAITGLAAGQTLNDDGSVNVPGAQRYNQCGVAKWSCVTAPGRFINGSNVTVSNGVPSATYASLSGTSMAAPHAAGALAVIMERFPYMTNAQALEVMKTTAVQNATLRDATGAHALNPNAGKLVEVPDERNGWGTVSLRHAMNGPGQLLGRFAVDTQGHNDSWSNNISDVAIKARKLEDEAEAATWQETLQTRGWQNGLPADASEDDRTEYEMGLARAAARNTRVYEGSLAKHGEGSLVLAGDNSYSGGTEVFGGTLLGRSSNAFGSGDVLVHGGTLAGFATIAGDLLNEAGLITPGEMGVSGGIGSLSVLGNFAQFPSGMLGLEFGGEGADLLNVAGTAFLGGSLVLTALEGFMPTAAISFVLMAADNFLGQFSGVQFAGLSSAYTASLIYEENAVRLSISAVPEPQPLLMLLAGLGLMGWWLRRRRGGRDAA